MSKKDILHQLIAYYSNGNKTQFANMLGITPQGLSSWLSRNTFDVDLVFAKCVGVSANWLLTGEGQMLVDRKTNTCQPADDHAAMDLIRDLTHKIADLSVENGRLRERISLISRNIRGGDFLFIDTMDALGSQSGIAKENLPENSPEE